LACRGVAATLAIQRVRGSGGLVSKASCRRCCRIFQAQYKVAIQTYLCLDPCMDGMDGDCFKHRNKLETQGLCTHAAATFGHHR